MTLDRVLTFAFLFAGIMLVLELSTMRFEADNLVLIIMMAVAAMASLSLSGLGCVIELRKFCKR